MTVRQPPKGKGYDLQGEYTVDLDPFWFRWADQWWELPHLKMLDFEVQLDVFTLQDKVADITDVEGAKTALNDLFALLMDADQLAEFVKVPRPINFLMDMLDKWRQHCGVTEEDQGESSASASSSTSTGRPSKRTSTGSTASASRKPSTPRARKSATPRGNSSSASAT